jgi:exoribonuclease II
MSRGMSEELEVASEPYRRTPVEMRTAPEVSRRQSDYLENIREWNSSQNQILRNRVICNAIIPVRAEDKAAFQTQLKQKVNYRENLTVFHRF